MTVDQLVEKIASVAFSDSHVDISRKTMKVALEHDLAANGFREPSDEEIEMMVCGNDDGEIPKLLKKLYPNTCDELAEYWA